METAEQLYTQNAARRKRLMLDDSASDDDLHAPAGRVQNVTVLKRLRETSFTGEVPVEVWSL